MNEFIVSILLQALFPKAMYDVQCVIQTEGMGLYFFTRLCRGRLQTFKIKLKLFWASRDETTLCVIKYMFLRIT